MDRPINDKMKLHRPLDFPKLWPKIFHRKENLEFDLLWTTPSIDTTNNMCQITPLLGKYKIPIMELNQQFTLLSVLLVPLIATLRDAFREKLWKHQESNLGPRTAW